MRAANRKLNKAYVGKCKHVKYDDNFVFYCDAGEALGPDCSEGCSKYLPFKPVHFTNRVCRISIHMIDKFQKEFKRNKNKF